MSSSQDNNKRIAKNTLFLYIRMVLIMAVTLYTSRLVLAMLGVDDYGIYNVVGGVVTMFAFLNGTMSGVTQRFITYELGTGNTEKLKNVFRTSIALHNIIAIIFLFLAETIGLWFVCNKLVIPDSRRFAATCVYQFSIISTLILIISVPYNACIIAHEKMSAFAYISIMEVILKLLIVFLLPIIGADKLILYALLMLVIHILVRVVYTTYCLQHFVEARKKGKFDRSIAKEMVGFTSWSLFGGFASVGMNQGLNILLNIFFGPTVNAARAIAVQVDTAIYSFVQNFQMAIKPQIVKSYASGNFHQMNSLVYAGSKFSFFLLLAISMPFFLEAPYVLNLWLKEVPNYTVGFLRLTLLVAMVNTLATPLMTAANANGNINRYQVICGILQLLLIPLSYALLLFCSDPIIVFWAYFVITILTQVARLYIVSNLVNLKIVDYLRRVIVPIIRVLCLAPTLPIILHMSMSYGFLRLSAVIGASLISTFISVYFLGISNNEKAFLKNVLYKYRKKNKNDKTLPV